jgi:hypothetical protein
MHFFFISASFQLFALVAFRQATDPTTQQTAAWVGPTIGLDGKKVIIGAKNGSQASQL